MHKRLAARGIELFLEQGDALRGDKHVARVIAAKLLITPVELGEPHVLAAQPLQLPVRRLQRDGCRLLALCSDLEPAFSIGGTGGQRRLRCGEPRSALPRLLEVALEEADMLLRFGIKPCALLLARLQRVLQLHEPGGVRRWRGLCRGRHGTSAA